MLIPSQQLSDAIQWARDNTPTVDDPPPTGGMRKGDIPLEAGFPGSTTVLRDGRAVSIPSGQGAAPYSVPASPMVVAPNTLGVDPVQPSGAYVGAPDYVNNPGPPPSSQTVRFGGKKHPMDLPVAILAALSALSGRQGRQFAMGLGGGLLQSREQRTQEANQNALQQWQYQNASYQQDQAKRQRLDELAIGHKYDMEKLAASQAANDPKLIQKTIDGLNDQVKANKGATADALRRIHMINVNSGGTMGYPSSPEQIARAEANDAIYNRTQTVGADTKEKQGAMYEAHGAVYSSQAEYNNKVKIPHGLILNHILTMQAPALGAKPGIDNALKQKQMDNLSSTIARRDALVQPEIALKESQAALDGQLASVVGPKARAYIAALDTNTQVNFDSKMKGEVNKALHDQLAIAQKSVDNTRKLIENYRNHASLIQNDDDPLKKQDIATANSLEQNELAGYKQTYADLQQKATENRLKMGLDADGKPIKVTTPGEIKVQGNSGAGRFSRQEIIESKQLLMQKPGGPTAADKAAWESVTGLKWIGPIK